MTVENAYQKALGYLSKSPKTIRQMKAYLTNKGYDPNIIEQVIAQLSNFNYLDDRAFARQFIESRIRYNPKSVFALEFELRKKGIDPALTGELLTAYKDEDLALKAIENKKQAWRRLNESDRRKKMMNYLRYRGFNYSVCQTVWQIFETTS
ncbi:regulatory protein RecX [Desulfobacter latus]|uniref:Regulatory protein RecX n=1 Tax=Desulfobacter latus TaxID=2292 RepID=A0A850ST35_9BACT|nr:regulatory protein RecX [Desulfobacter latus]NWH04544.1 regulatory protein RecX [Desulfobacter latus]